MKKNRFVFRVIQKIKMVFFWNSVYLAPPLGVTLLELHQDLWHQKLHCAIICVIC